MQQSENSAGEAAVELTDLPNALIACKVLEDVFNDDHLKVNKQHIKRGKCNVHTPAECTSGDYFCIYIAHKLGYFGLHYSMSTIIVRRGVLECRRLGLFSGPITVIE